jgi:uncharacterized integral membrane protein
MSADRPAAEGPEPAPADSSPPPEPEVAAPADAEATLPEHTIEPTRTSMVWTMVGIGVVLLVAFLVFILQNGQRVRVRFLMVDGTLQLGVALLFAAPARRHAGAGGGRGPGAAAARGHTAPSSHRPGTVAVDPRPLAMSTKSHAFGNPTRG